MNSFKLSITEKLVRITIYFIISIFIATIILPFIHIIALSLNEGIDTSKGGIALWPRVFTLKNYEEVFKDPYLLNSFKISILRVIIGTPLSVFLTAMAAFALKSKILPGRKFFTLIILFTMLFSGGIIPYYILLKSLKLLNNFLVYIIPFFYSGWNTLLMRTFFSSIPKSLEDSAMIDGANYFKIFLSIYLPLSKPIISVIALFNGVTQWNDWFSGTFFVSQKSLHPLQTVLRAMLMSAEAMRKKMFITGFAALFGGRATVTSESLKMATIMIATIPIVCIYPFVQKYFVKGIMIGSIKE